MAVGRQPTHPNWLTFGGQPTTLRSMETTDVAIPEWTLGWRLQRAMVHAGLQIDDMAAELGVSRSTISRFLNDNGGPPRSGYVKLWALRTGVPLEWLLNGDVEPRISPAVRESKRWNSAHPADLQELVAA